MACLVGAVSAGGDHGSHGHPEYLALYSLGVSGSYVLELGGDGDEDSIEFMVVPSSSADHEGLEEAEVASAAAWEEFFSGAEAPASLPDGSSAIPSRSVVYTASLMAGGSSGGPSSSVPSRTTTNEQVVAAVTVPLAVAEAGAYTLLLNHGEIPAALVSPAGETLAPVISELEDPHEEEEEEEGSGGITAGQWANALAASLLISVCSGRRQGTRNEGSREGEEGSTGNKGLGHDLENGRQEQQQQQQQQQQQRRRPSEPSEAADPGGAVKPAAAAAATAATAARSGSSHAVAVGGGPAAAGGAGPTPAGLVASSLHDANRLGADRGLFDVAGLDPVCWNVILGDLAHNFSDGVTMAAAFLGCSPAVGWTITAANMMHEIPHEVGNFMALVNGGMSAKQALLYNFFSALFAVFGVVLTFSLRDLITQTAISYLLLLGAGTFVFVGLSELVPHALSSGGSSRSGSSSAAAALDGTAGGDDDAGQKQTKKQRKALHRSSQARKALAFTVGAVLLGLPLLSHRHCDAGGDHGHDHF
eukprot:g7814.t1